MDNTLPSCCYAITMIFRVRMNFFEITTFPNNAMQLKLVDISIKEAQFHQVAKLLVLQLLGRANLS